MVAGCGDGSTSTGSSVAVVTGAAATATPTPTPTATATATSTGACIANPAETAGPYPADGANSASGSTNNVLTSTGIVRSDIRKSFIGTTTDAGGVLVTITLTLVNVNATCAPLSGYATYLWHADRYGHIRSTLPQRKATSAASRSLTRTGR